MLRLGAVKDRILYHGRKPVAMKKAQR